MNDLLDAIRANLYFLLTAAGIVLLFVLIAAVCEKKLIKCRQVSKAKYLALTGACSALAGVLMLFELPLFFAPVFYKLDFSEIPVLFCGFYLGPTAGILCEAVKIIVKLVIKGTTSAFVGDFANFLVGCFFIVPAVSIYHIRKTKRNAKVGLSVGTLIMTVGGSLFNYFYLIPKFSQLYGIPLDAIISMGTAVNSGIQSLTTLIVLAVVPFNLLKGIVDSLVCLLLYKKTESVLFR